MPETKSATQRYRDLARWRDPFLSKGRQAAGLTLPYLLPSQGHTGLSSLPEPYQTEGGFAVTNLGGRITNRLMPASLPFFRLQPPGDASIASAVTEGKETTGDIERDLAVLEQGFLRKINTLNWRTVVLQLNLQLIVTGNVLVWMMPGGNLKLFRLDQFVVRRGQEGQILELMIEEFLQKEEVPDGVNMKEDVMSSNVTTDQPRNEAEETVPLYTWVRLEDDGTYSRKQFIGDKQVASDGPFTPDELPYRHLGWNFIPGEDYAHGKVEDHMGAFRTLETMSKAQIELAAMASKHYIFIRPGTNAKGIAGRIMKAPNGQAIVADPEAVDLKTFESIPGSQITAAEVDRAVQTIARSFLLSSVAQRNAERVTATEIQRDIEEIEAGVGPIFTVLATQLMKWAVRMIMLQTEELPPEIPELTDIQILTGLEALAREQALGRALEIVPLLQVFGEDIKLMLETYEFLSPALAGAGFPRAVVSSQEFQRRQAQQALQQAAAQGVESAISAVGQQAGAAIGQGG